MRFSSAQLKNYFPQESSELCLSARELTCRHHICPLRSRNYPAAADAGCVGTGWCPTCRVARTIPPGAESPTLQTQQNCLVRENRQQTRAVFCFRLYCNEALRTTLSSNINVYSGTRRIQIGIFFRFCRHFLRTMSGFQWCKFLCVTVET